METRGFPETHELGLSLHRARKENSCSSSVSKQTTHTWVPTSTGLIGRPVQGYEVSRLLILTAYRAEGLLSLLGVHTRAAGIALPCAVEYVEHMVESCLFIVFRTFMSWM